MKISHVFKYFKGRKESQVERRGERMWERGKNGWPYRYALPPADTQALRDFTLGLYPGTLPSREGSTGTQPYQKPSQTRTEPKWVHCQKEVISLQFSAQAEAVRPDSYIQDQGTRKRGRRGRIKERKERRMGREVNKASCSWPGWGTLASCLCQEETKDKRVPAVATGSGPLVAKLVPEWSGCQSQWRRVRQSLHLLQEGGHLPGPETRLLFNTWKWTIWGDKRADKARDFIGKGCSGIEK